MESWSAEVDKLGQQGDRITDLSSRLSSYGRDVQSAGNLRGISIASKEVLQRRIDEIVESIRKQANTMRSMGDGLSEISLNYERTENTLLGRADEIKVNVNEGKNTVGKGEEDEEEGGWFKAVLSFFENVLDKPGAGLLSNFLSYLEDFRDFLKDTKAGWTGFGEWCDLGKTSSDLWDALYGFFKGHDSSGLLEEHFGAVSAGVGLVGSIFGLLGKLSEAIGSDSSDIPGKIADFLEAGGEGLGVGESIFGLKHLKDAAGAAKDKLLDAASKWVALGETALSTLGQTIRSVAEYASDGEFDITDFGATGVDASLAGLDKLLSAVTFGIVSSETIGTTPEEISDKLKNWAEDTGTSLGEGMADYLREHPDLDRQSRSKNPFERAGASFQAFFGSIFD